MAGAARMVAIDPGNGYIGAYATYTNKGELLRVAIINTEFPTGGGLISRRVILGGISEETAYLRRLSAKDPMTTDGARVSFGGVSFLDRSCELGGREHIENIEVVRNQLTIDIRSSEAVLLDFQ
jgi:glycosyl hydrolase family 79